MSTSVRRSGSGSAIAAAMAFCCSDPAQGARGVLDSSACCNRVSGNSSKSAETRCLWRCSCARIARTGLTRRLEYPHDHAHSQAAYRAAAQKTRTHRTASHGGRHATLVGCITPGRPPRAQRGRLCTQGATAGRACKGADGRQTPRGCTLRSFQRQRRAAQTQRHSLGAAPAAPRAAVRRTSY